MSAGQFSFACIQFIQFTGTVSIDIETVSCLTSPWFPVLVAVSCMLSPNVVSSQCSQCPYCV